MTGNRFINAMSTAGYGWVVSICWPDFHTMTIVDFYTMTIAIMDGPLREEDNSGEEDDFDALLTASSFGSEQARAIREQTPTAAREHARRVLDGQEKRAPAGPDVDDAVGGLVYGLAHGVVPGPTALILANSTLTPRDLHTALSDHDPARSNRVVVVTACQTSMLWPDHRARLLQALIDHDAFASLRYDVAWKIIDWTFDVPRPPRVLRQCAELAVEQIDFSAIAHTWLISARGKAPGCSCEPCVGYLQMSAAAALPDIHLQQETPPERSGGPVSAMPALDSAPPRAALPAGSARPATTVQADTAAATRRQSARRTHARTRRVPPGPRTDRRKAAHRRPSAITARKAPRTAAPSSRRLAVTLTVGAAVIATAIVLFLGVLQSAISSGLRTAIPSAQQEPLGSINELPVIASAPRHDVAVALPFVLLFASNSAVLRPGANAVLLPIVYQARSEHLAVSITGYASPEGGTAAYNLALSARRANAVRDRLISLGVPAIQITHVTGVGTAGWSSNACAKEDKPDEATCADLRRVVIRLSPAKKDR